MSHQRQSMSSSSGLPNLRIVNRINEHQEERGQHRESMERTLSQTEAEFPLQVFPNLIGDYLRDQQAASKLPIDFYACSVLSVAAGAIGNSIKLRLKHGYLVNSTLYLCIVGHASSGKTPCMRAALKPMEAIEKKHYEEYAEAMQAYDPEVDKTKPKYKDVIIKDATMEAVNQALNGNNKGLLLFIDELVGWLKGMNSYRSGADMEAWLSNWSGTPIKVNRVSKAPIYIASPSINVLGGIQPGILKDLTRGNNDINGFNQRLLYCWPDAHKKPGLSRAEPSFHLIQQYEKAICFLHELPHEEPRVLNLTNEAFEIYEAWFALNAEAINKTFDERIKASYAKLDQYCLRFALILECLYAATGNRLLIDGEQISVRVMQGAISLTEYFRYMADKVYDKVDGINPLAELPEIHQHFFNRLATEFATADAQTIGQESGMSERTIRRLLKNSDLFEKIKHGRYRKIAT